jgi:hypothetical protein
MFSKSTNFARGGQVTRLWLDWRVAESLTILENQSDLIGPLVMERRRIKWFWMTQGKSSENASDDRVHLTSVKGRIVNNIVKLAAHVFRVRRDRIISSVNRRSRSSALAVSQNSPQMRVPNLS